MLLDVTPTRRFTFISLLDENVIIIGVQVATSLVLDLENRMIYWNDELTNKIERSNLRTVVIETIGQPASLVLTKIEGDF